MKRKRKNILGKDITYYFENVEHLGYYGLYDGDNSKIVLDKKLKGDLKKHIQLHEEFHAVFDRLSLNRTSIPHDIQEVIVDGFSLFVVEMYNIREKRRK